MDQITNVGIAQINGIDYWKLAFQAGAESGVCLVLRKPKCFPVSNETTIESEDTVTVSSSVICKYVFPFCLRLGNDQGKIIGEIKVDHEKSGLEETPDILLNDVIRELKRQIWIKVNVMNTIGELFILNEITTDNIVTESKINQKSLTYSCFEEILKRFHNDYIMNN